MLEFLAIFFFAVFIFAIILRLIINRNNKQNTNDDESSSNSNNINNAVLENTIETNKALTKEYKIAGVTYNNENEKSIQKEISKILREYVQDGSIDKEDMYLGYTTSDIKDMDLEVSQYEDIPFNAKLEESTFENKPCVKVYMQRADGQTYTHVGYIQKRYNQIQEVIDILHNYKDIKLTLYVVGGKIKKCKMDYDDEYNEKFYVETITLDYGLRLFIEYK